MFRRCRLSSLSSSRTNLPELAPYGRLQVQGFRFKVGRQSSSSFHLQPATFQPPVGCRGFTGPVPLPLWIRVSCYSVVGGDYTRMIAICQIGFGGEAVVESISRWVIHTTRELITMHLMCLSCEVLARPLYLSAARSPHIVDIELFRKGLHNEPADLRGTAPGAHRRGIRPALRLSRHGLRPVRPGDRRPDCPQHPDRHPARPRLHHPLPGQPRAATSTSSSISPAPTGTRTTTSSGATGRAARCRSARAASRPGRTTSTRNMSRKYGKDNADYLMEVMGGWQKHYKRAAYIDMGWQMGARSRPRLRLRRSAAAGSSTGLPATWC